MNSENGKISFNVGLNTSQLQADVRKAQNEFAKLGSSITAEGDKMDNAFSGISRSIASIGVAWSAQGLARKIAEVRGEFQQLEVAFTTMLRSETKAAALMQQLVHTAAVTPFGLQDVASGAKQLLAYGTAAEDVNDTLIRLGNISAGLSQPMGDLVYLYGTTMTQGRLYTQDLNQFTGRGIPMIRELAKQFGVAEGEVKKLVETGKVGFPEVQKVIMSLTNEGGMFFNLMAAQSKTITGQISNLEDAFDMMFNNIGQSSEGIISDAISGATYLVENYEAVGREIMALAMAYGAYKAAVMSVSAIENLRVAYNTQDEIEGLKNLLGIKEQVSNADLQAAVASGRLTEAKAAELAALREEMTLKLASLETAEKEAVANLASAQTNFDAAKKRLQAAEDAIDGMDDWIARAEELGDTELANTYRTQLAEKATELQSASIQYNTAQKSLNDAATKKKAASEALATATTNMNTIANHANTASMTIMKRAALQLTGIMRGLWATLMANPIVIVGAAIGAVAYGIYKFATRADAAEKVTESLNTALDELGKKQDELKKTTDELVGTLGDVNTSEGERIDNFQKLKAEYPEILKNINDENQFLSEKHNLLRMINEEQGRRAQADIKAELDSAEKQLQYLRIRKSQGINLVDLDGNGLATDNTDEAIEAQLKKVNQLKVKYAETDVTKYMSGIKDLSSEEITSVISEINTAFQALGKSGDDALAIVTQLGGQFSKEQLTRIKTALEGEQSNRTGDKKTGAGWLKQYKSEYDKAQKELDAFQQSKDELSAIEYERRLKELQEKRDAAKKKYEEAAGSTIKQQGKGEDERMKAQEDADEMLLKLQQKNLSEEISLMREGREKKLKEIKAEYEERKLEISTQAKDMAEANKEAGVTDVNSEGLTGNQQKEIDAANKLNEDSRKKSIAEVYQSEADALRDYLKNYGTYQQQKLVIAQEYAEKIRKASTDGERLSYEKERDNTLANIETANLKANMNWETIFGEFGGMFKEIITPALEDAKKYAQTDEFKNADQASQKALIDAIRQMEEAIGGAGEVSFKKLGQEVQAYQRAQVNLRLAQDQYKGTFSALTAAQNAYKDAMVEGTEEEQEAARKALQTAKDNEQAAAANVQAMQTAADNAKDNMTQTATTLKSSMDGVVGGLQKLASGSLSGAYNGLIELGKGAKDIGGKLGDAFGKVSEALEDVPIVGWIVQIIDLFKDGLSVVIEGLLDAIFNAVSGIIGDILSGDLFATIGESLLSGIGKIFDSITWGGFSSWFGSGESDKTLHEDIERLTATNEALERAIDNLADVMNEAAVKDSTELYNQQKKLLDESEANTQEMMRRSGAAYSNGFLGVGGSHSSNHKINEAMSSSDWNRISRIVGRTIDSAGDFWDLTSEQMNKIATDAPDLYAKIKDLADNGHENAAQYMDEYIEYAKQREELEDAYREKLTSYSFDDVRSEFKNMLTDFTMSWSDMTKNFNAMLVESIAESLMSEKYDPMIKKLYEKWAKFMEDGELTDAELEQIQADRDAIYSSMEGDRKFLESLSNGSSSSSQNSTKKGVTTASQDSIDEMNGRLTGVQMDVNAVRHTIEQYGIDLAFIRTAVAANKENTEEIRNLSLAALDYLESISRNTHELYEMNERLEKIEKNTRKL